jgi:DNA mismatch repair protein MutL
MPPGAQSEALYGPRDATDAGATGGGEADAMEREDAVTGAAAGERPLWSLHGTYLLTPTDEGVMLIDQRAAHVRILYERALGRLERERGESQQLLFPHTFDLAPADVPLFDALAGDLRALGFEAERLSGRTVIVRGVPPDARTSDEQALLEELLEAYKTAPATAGGEAARTKRREHLARLAARQQAVPHGQTLAPAERRALVRDLFACAMPYADPTGTPTILRLSMEELAKRFGS